MGLGVADGVGVGLGVAVGVAVRTVVGVGVLLATGLGVGSDPEDVTPSSEARTGVLMRLLASRRRTFSSPFVGGGTCRTSTNGCQIASRKSADVASMYSVARPIWSGPPPEAAQFSLVNVIEIF